MSAVVRSRAEALEQHVDGVGADQVMPP